MARATGATGAKKVTDDAPPAETAPTGPAAGRKTVKAAKAPSKAAKATKATSEGSAPIDSAPADDARKTAAKPAATKAAPAKPAAKAERAADYDGDGDADSETLEQFLAGQRTLLATERSNYNRQAEMLTAEAEALAVDRDPGDVQFDEESGEGDTINVERERDLALSAQARGFIDEIDRAVAKIDAGTYGKCEQCGDPIPRERLKALPYAALCVRCKSGGLGRR